MTRIFSRLVFLTLILGLIPACPAKKKEEAAPSPTTAGAPAAAQPDLSSPVAATKTFYNSVNDEKYDISWKSLTKTSQDKIVTMVAEEEKMDPKEVRKLFDTNSPAIQGGFWKSFRNSSKVSEYAPMAAYKLVKEEGNVAEVQLANKLVVLESKAYKEGGEWKMGYVESFMPDNKTPAKP